MKRHHTIPALCAVCFLAATGCKTTNPEEDPVAIWEDGPTACEETAAMRVPTDGGPHDGDGGPADDHAETYGDDAAPRHVNLGFIRDPSITAGVTWETGLETLASVVEFRHPDLGSAFVEGKSFAVDVLGGEHDQVRVHEGLICDLLPSTTYTYRVGGPEAWSAEHQFTTAPDPAEDQVPLRFVVLGDSNFGYNTWGTLTDAVAVHAPDLVIHTGDVLQGGHSQPEWEAWFTEAQELLGDVPLIIAHGNHDDLAGLYFAHVVHPGNEEFFSFDWANAHFVFLNDCEREEDVTLVEEVTFLADDLAAATQTWTFAFHHRPPYCSHDGGNQTIREAWCPLYDQHHVDIVFNGHWHLYERMVPIYDQAAAASPAEGTIYVVTGGAGAAMYDCGESDLTHLCEETNHYVVVDIDGDDLTFSAYRKDGSLLDSFEISKQR
jgi:large repetitive protein